VSRFLSIKTHPFIFTINSVSLSFQVLDLDQISHHDYSYTMVALLCFRFPRAP
jgi:hypothetical protein